MLSFLFCGILCSTIHISAAVTVAYRLPCHPDQNKNKALVPPLCDVQAL